MFKKLLRTRNDGVLTLIRVVAGGVMLPHGMQKMFGWFGGAGFSGTIHGFGQRGFPAPLVILVIAAEFLGSIGLILGFVSRIAAFGIAVDMTVAAIMVTSKFGLFINWAGKQKGEGMEYQLLMIGMTLAIVIAGGGALSVDRALAGGK
ncbi:MAG TPA: DoxX family protein [Candidatus Acidoferrales bacterium]|jgi:putative oxidoreductase|nr:DoxX family protein [Candidatus Acidoferrales bacterium]